MVIRDRFLFKDPTLLISVTSQNDLFVEHKFSFLNANGMSKFTIMNIHHDSISSFLVAPFIGYVCLLIHSLYLPFDSL